MASEEDSRERRGSFTLLACGLPEVNSARSKSSERVAVRIDECAVQRHSDRFDGFGQCVRFRGDDAVLVL